MIDTGVLFGHEDLVGRFVTGIPAGFDFVSNPTIANDGDGRDSNAADPGDWVSSTEAGTGVFADCLPMESTWHGTMVSGITGATANNAKGIAGIGWIAQILPVRALGKCGIGEVVDMRDAITWSAGLPVAGAPSNPNPARVVNMSFGVAGSCEADGTVFAWGYIFFGQVGPGPFDFEDRWTPVQVSGLTDIVAIAAGGKRSLALRRDGVMFAWGAESNVSPDGQTASVSSAPIQVQGLSDVVGIAAGGDATTGVDVDVSMALAWDGKLYAWGWNDFGQLGDGTITESFVPQHVSALTTPVVSFATGGWHSLALLENGTLWGWGYNGEGEVGDGTTDFRTSPVLVSGELPKTIELIAGGFHSIAFLGDFRLFTRGDNAGGQLGDGTQNNRSSPVQVIGFGPEGFRAVALADSADAIIAGNIFPNLVTSSRSSPEDIANILDQIERARLSHGRSASPPLPAALPPLPSTTAPARS